ncbi:hypothetical protein CLOSTASPAR_04084 [[Clostridium] asparagiforme DSM 15981]|uniref:Uncharacterized protein n=1 Tax=[Clostridium] asparagiforme DSM 15981 TaxID=518636 RepID=C0D490_9FIRM|nr:hypothetical protein CLOSTASPAR_04084 [[Clostridium] asparagiforme DSM 15981]
MHFFAFRKKVHFLSPSFHTPTAIILTPSASILNLSQNSAVLYFF